jgi:hypothetical protein
MIISPAQDNGRKRHIAVDTLGLILAVLVTAASVQDRDGAFQLLASLRERHSTITLIWLMAAMPVAWSAGPTRSWRSP